MHITGLRTIIAGKNLYGELETQIARSRDLADLMGEDMTAPQARETIDEEFMHAYDILIRCTSAVVSDLWVARLALERELSGGHYNGEFAAQTYNEAVFYPLNEFASQLRAIIRKADALAEHEAATEALRDVAQSSALPRLAHVCENIADLGPATTDYHTLTTHHKENTL